MSKRSRRSTLAFTIVSITLIIYFHNPSNCLSQTKNYVGTNITCVDVIIEFDGNSRIRSDGYIYYNPSSDSAFILAVITSKMHGTIFYNKVSITLSGFPGTESTSLFIEKGGDMHDTLLFDLNKASDTPLKPAIDYIKSHERANPFSDSRDYSDAENKHISDKENTPTTKHSSPFEGPRKRLPRIKVKLKNIFIK
ncbi:hypothetical protein [Rubinisphaera sp.]|uniref:hypothetical protein n=1 Tax=Rubinisphaera sp. TaxID=2024857 RepID=UPI0025ED663E|nr:hypothetical protein [Rubinisphaera sp.]|tara:strand:- start:746 stop:1330 length:585 start_codon:yes stop_codon:yes gene_type:complete